MKKKLELHTLKVKSFVTHFEEAHKQTANLKGGTNTTVNSAFRLCIDPDTTPACTNASNCGPCGSNTCPPPSNTCPPPSNGCTITLIQLECQDSRDVLCIAPA